MENRTTIQVSEELRKELKVLAAKRDLSYQDLLQDMTSVFKELDRDNTILSVKRSLAEKVEEKIENTDINSVSEYVTFLLRLVLSEDSENISEINEEKVRKRLENLGYL